MSGRTKSRAAARLVIGVLVVTTFTLGAIAPAGADASPKTPVRVHDDFSSGSIEFVVEGVEAIDEVGSYKVVFTNDSIGPHVLIVFKIPDGWTEAQVLAALHDDEPPEDSFFAGEVFAKPGQTHQKKVEAPIAGTYTYFCPIETPAGVPHFDLGFVGVFEVA